MKVNITYKDVTHQYTGQVIGSVVAGVSVDVNDVDELNEALDIVGRKLPSALNPRTSTGVVQPSAGELTS